MYLPYLLSLLFQDGEPAVPAQEEAPPSNPFMNMLPLVAVFVIFWFILIAPERKARKRKQELMSALKKGDKVLTTGGMYGTVAQMQDDVVTLQIADGVRVRVARPAIQGVVEDGGGESSS